jgi:hypothetical protein
MKPNLVYMSMIRKLGAAPKLIKFSDYLKAPRKEMIEEVRSGVAKKHDLPAIIPAGLFRGDYKAENLYRLTGFASFDIDYLKPGELESIKEELKKQPWVYYLSKSVSGEGLWGMVKFKCPDQYVFQYSGLLEQLKEMDIKPDATSANINRLRFYSWDEDEYLNENVESFARFGDTLRAKSATIVDFSIDHNVEFNFMDRAKINNFNRSHECQDLFEAAGWEIIGENYAGQMDVLRPGSSKTRSGNIVSNKFWCFTNSTAFPPDSLSEPFDCYVFLFHDGDVWKALRAI